MIVIDASALLEVLLRRAAVHAVETRLFAAGETLHAPHLLDVEAAHVLRRFASKGELDDARGRAALARLAGLPIQRYPHHILLPRIWGLRHNLSAYDAAYIALAEALDAVLVTCDQRLANAAGHRARVHVCERQKLPQTPASIGLSALLRQLRRRARTAVLLAIEHAIASGFFGGIETFIGALSARLAHCANAASCTAIDTPQPKRQKTSRGGSTRPECPCGFFKVLLVLRAAHEACFAGRLRMSGARSCLPTKTEETTYVE